MNMVLVLTGTIQPSNKMIKLSLTNIEERLKQYKESIKYFINSGAFSEIIFCENSGYGIEQFEDLIKEAREQCVMLEVLSFKGDSDIACAKGKGFGEGEILQYAFENSCYLKKSNYFIKITGRLIVDNILTIVRNINGRIFYINVPNRHHLEIVDTRIYAMQTKTYRTYFMDAYNYVDDKNNFFLEHAFTNVINENKLKTKNLPKYPRIVGVSGSTGINYSYSKMKCTLKDLLSIINAYALKNS